MYNLSHLSCYNIWGQYDIKSVCNFYFYFTKLVIKKVHHFFINYDVDV